MIRHEISPNVFSASAVNSNILSSKAVGPKVTIRVSGKLLHGHLFYLEQLVQTAAECCLWPLLSLMHLEELDRAALFYLMNGENRDFGIVSCPDFIREWMQHERQALALE
jgi:hypothetical protein